MKRAAKRLAIVGLALCLLAGLLSGCGGRASQDRVPLVVACTGLDGVFSPFSGTAADQSVTEMTQLSLLTTDRNGLIVQNAIEGETRAFRGTEYSYTGIADLDIDYDDGADTTTYTWTLRRGLRFSDGEKLTADDVIFTYYVLLDPAYDGRNELRDLPIVGLQNYLTQTTDAVYSKYALLAGDIQSAGREAASDEMSQWYWDVGMKAAWTEHCRRLVDYCLTNYGDEAQSAVGRGLDEGRASESLQVLFGMVVWGLAKCDGQIVTGLISGENWRAEDTDLEKYYQETMLAYAGDPAAFFAGESTGEERVSVIAAARRAFIRYWGGSDPENNGAVSSIEGIQKIDDYTVSLTLRGQSEEAPYRLGIQVAPLHYYGDKNAYDYAAGNYGHGLGDLSAIREKDSEPLGAGPYRFMKYENGVAYLEANARYWRGKPLTYYLEFKDLPAGGLVDGIRSGEVDIAAPVFSAETERALKQLNPEGSLSGSAAQLCCVDLPVYAYVGLNAAAINVGGNPSSEASRNLRKGLATVLAACRTGALEQSLGSRAALRQDPVSGSCWAAPAAGREAYALSLTGEALYTEQMDAAARTEAARQAAVDFLKAAGFSWNENRQHFDAAPAGARLDYEFLLPALSGPDSAARLLAEAFRDNMEVLGISIRIQEEGPEESLAQQMEAGTHEIWFGTRSAGIEPGLYSLYHSTNIPGRSGNGTNLFSIETPELDAALATAAGTGSRESRKEACQAAMDIVLDWGVELPFYQPQGCYVFSPARVKLESLVPGMTCYWSWAREVEKLEMILPE